MKRFGSAEVLRAAAVRAWPGRVTVLLGRNGSGKSTLLRCALGIRAADNGSVTWRGDATLRPRLVRMARGGLFFLPDRGLAVPHRRVETHVHELRAALAPSASLAARDPLEVRPFSNSRIRQLSGGERRRVELTLALLRDPVCLIADEPLTGLAPADQERAVRALRDGARRGTAVIVTGHEVEMLLSLADEVVWIVAGGTRVLGSPEQAWAHPEFARQYLGRRRPLGSRRHGAVSAAVPVGAGVAATGRPALPGRGTAWLRRMARVWLPVAASAALIWAAIRALVATFRTAVPLPGVDEPGSRLVTEVSLPLVAVCVLLAWVNQRRRGGVSWLANLGLGPRESLLLWTGTCLGLEILLVSAAAWLR